MAQKIRSAEDGLAPFLRTVPEPGGPPITPKEGEANILITSALPYCNNVPHLGNIIGSLLSADVASRYNRAMNRRTMYICGTDEYGTATETQALKEGLTPKELCDKYHVLHRETYQWFEIGFDYFGRTTTQHHTDISQGIYSNLAKHGLLERQEELQTYCEGCSKFLADRFVEGICPHCGYEDARGDQCDGCSRPLDPIELIKPRCLVNKTHQVAHKIASHMYFKLQDVQPKLEEWIKTSFREGRWSSNGTISTDGKFIDARLKEGLRPTPLTRDLKWGVPVPTDEQDKEGMKGKVLYVWFDAPIGYPSITANYTSEWEKWWFNPKDVKLYQFMGKDNVYFHTIYFPSVQIGEGRSWTKLHHLSTTEYLTYEGGKFSKSKNRGVFGPNAKETGIPASVWRFYLLSQRPENADTTFSWVECLNHNNNILLNNFGNFCNRALKFCASQYGGVVPDSGDPPGPLSPNDPVDGEFIAKINSLLAKYIDEMDAVKLRAGSETAMAISSEGNTYLQSSGLNKALMASNPQRCAQVISRALNLIYILSAVIYPYMPSTASNLLVQLNAPPRTIPTIFSNEILPGHEIGKPAHLFRKIDDKMIDVWRAKFKGVDEQETATAAPTNTTVADKKKGQKKYAGPVTPEMQALEAKIQEQGDLVRKLKGETPKTQELDAKIKEQVEVLKKLKADLARLQEVPGA